LGVLVSRDSEIRKKAIHPVNTHCQKTKKNRMNTDPAGDPRSDIRHPDHLDYFARIVCEHMGRRPQSAPDAFIAPGAFLSGDVTLRSRSSVWPSASLRADIASIEIGEESNVQDNAVIHVATDLGVRIGRRVTIGHSAIIHACTIGDESLIGMGAIILDGAVIGERCLIGAHATVLMNTMIPPGSMAVGSPARIVRTLSEEEQAGLGSWADHYLVLASEYRRRGIIHPAYQQK
jgi:carbonic anhydrase/acetyltransferase-like protein (isoleucine patch superfamily)